MEKLKHFSLFSGIESFKKALTNLGIDNELVGYSEFDKYASVALTAIHGVSEDLNYGDITKIDETKLPDCDLITYGFPCQDISIAGLGKGIVEGETRSGLLYDALRIIKYKMPKYAIAENVKNLVSKRFKEDFDALLEELEGYGYNNYWQVLNAKDYGIPQNRERVFVVSVRKDIDKGYEFPKPYDSGLRLEDLLEDEVEDKYYIDNDRTVGSPTEQRLEPNNQGTTNTLTTVQKDNLVLEKVVCEQRTDEGLRFFKDNVCGTIRTIDSGGDKRVIEKTSNGLQLFTILKGGKWDKIHESDRRVYDEEGITPTIPTCSGGNTEPKVAVREATKLGYAIATVGDSINLEQPNSKTRRGRVGKEVAQTLTTSCNQATLEHDYKIRKLTPKECWRLMGFTDEDYWKVRTALEKTFYNGRDRSNSQMYKMAGNSIVVDVLEGILENLIS